MSSRLLAESLVELQKSAAHVPGRPHVSTLFRWTSAGCRSADGRVVRLESVRAGGRRFTSLEALDRFFQRLERPTHPARD